MGSLIGDVAKALALGPRVPMSPPPGFSWARSLAAWQQPPDAETQMRALGVMGTVWAVVTLYASATARPEWRLYRKTQDNRVRYTTRESGSDQRTEVVKHQALSVLNRPGLVTTDSGDMTVLSRFGLFEGSQQYLDLTGEAPWVVARDPRASFPTGLWHVRPDRIEPVPDPKTWLKGWLYTPPDGSQKIPLRPNEVIFTKYPNPLDAYRGMGPVQSVLVDIGAAKYSAEWNRNFFFNSAEPGGVVEVDHRMEDDEWDEFQARWFETHRGVNRAHRVAMLEAGAKWVPNQMTMRDMDFGNLRTQARDIVREAFRCHKVMIGVSDDVNRANAQTGAEVFSGWEVVPRLDRWKDTLNTQYLPLFGTAGTDVEFDYVAPVVPNREEDRAELQAKAQAAQFLVAAGYDPHDVLEVVGLPEMRLADLAAAAQPAPPAGPQPGDEGPGAGVSPADVNAELAALLQGHWHANHANGYAKAGAR